MNASQRRKLCRTIWNEWRSMSVTDQEKTLVEMTAKLKELQAENDRLQEQINAAIRSMK